MRNAGPILILLALVGLAALAFFGLSRDNDFDHSPLGNKGLQVWLEAKGIPVVRSDPHLARAGSELSLRILSLPISEGETAAAAGDEEKGNAGFEDWASEALKQGLPTLITMPKWHASLLKDGIAGPSDLLDLSLLQGELDKIDFSGLRLQRNGQGFESEQLGLSPDRSGRVSLYQAQTFDRTSLPEGCRQILGLSSGALIVRCEDNEYVDLLSDPDLLNNHGLALAENAGFAILLINNLRALNDKGPVYLDATGAPLDDTKPVDEGRTYERSGSDLERFFAYPLSVIWGTLFIVVAICFWRGFWRFGPPLKDASGNIELSKSAAIEATARLLRLSGNDGRMVSEFVLHLLADKAQLLFGPGAGNEAGIDRLFKRLARRDHAAAQALHSSAQALIDRGHLMKRADLHRNIETFRKSLGSIDFGSG
ncbi:hypothetical protein [Rhizobium mesosinicum]|uniref:DUF4350 domain-containing protein n=1 Tax=Rhizobium mesosinicum TaxID=335017 RepID=A0ABS7GYX1_9HYPH|nr:hypothetical protein [Rhizobium mesosinicum]MBW9054916.1 hypothetical protein [Rhizobium mesosinicum]